MNTNINLIKNSILCRYLIVLSIISSTIAIHVDFNTNTGPIIPPTSTQPPVPKPPFREPAPVWEDQSNDIPNPNPYRYVIPPTSRPPLNNPNNPHQQQTLVQQSPQPHQQPQFHPLQFHPPGFYQQWQPQQQQFQQQQQSYNNQQPLQQQLIPLAQQPYPYVGAIITHPNQLPDTQQSVPLLTVQYIPNVGNRYVAVAPVIQPAQYQPQKFFYLKSNEHPKQQFYNGQGFDKHQGKYNAKLKKYKAYDNVKYVPYNTYTKQPLYYSDKSTVGKA